MTSMLDVLKARWQTRGWHAMEKEDSEPMAIAFIRELDRHRIPHSQYMELYRRSVDLRARRLDQGLPCDDFSVDMMIACWPQLAKDLHQRDVDSGRFLPSTAASQCERCNGTDIETVYDREGNKLGARPGCKHEPVGEGEGLWIKLQSDHAAAAVLAAGETPTVDTIIATAGKHSADLEDAFRKLFRETATAYQGALPGSMDEHGWHDWPGDKDCEFCLHEWNKRISRAWRYAKALTED